MGGRLEKLCRRLQSMPRYLRVVPHSASVLAPRPSCLVSTGTTDLVSPARGKRQPLRLDVFYVVHVMFACNLGFQALSERFHRSNVGSIGS